MVLIILMILSWWFLSKKKYYVHIESLGEDIAAQEQVLKIELETTLRRAIEITKQVPCRVMAGDYFRARHLVKQLEKNGGVAKIEFHWVWAMPQEDRKPNEEDNGNPNELRNTGAVNFTIDDVFQVQDQQGTPNAKAYDYMVQAMSVSANYMGKDTIEEDVRIDAIYPTSHEQTMKMEELLDKSERAVKDENDEEYNKMITELRGIVGWSRRCHYNYSLLIIAGSVLTIGMFIKMFGGMGETLHKHKDTLAQVKEWSVDSDDAISDAIARDSVDRYGSKIAYKSPAYYKAYRLQTDEYWQGQYEESAQKNHYSMDTAQSKDSKQHFEKRYKRDTEKVKEYTKKVEEEKEWTPKQAKKDAIRRKKADIRAIFVAAIIFWLIQIFFYMLIPLYMIANYTRGYKITKYRDENKKLEEIRMWAFTIAAGLFGAATAIKYLPDLRVTVRKPNGFTSTYYESNPANAGKFSAQIVLLVLAVVILLAVSFGILIYSTWVGLKRNKEWKEVLMDAKKTAIDVAGKMNEKVNSEK